MSEEAKPEAITAFAIVKELDGSYTVHTDLRELPEVIAHQPDLFDVKQALSEVSDRITVSEIAEAVIYRMSQIEQGQNVPESMRKALKDRGNAQKEAVVFIEMTCTCNASFQGDGDQDLMITLWAQQFVSAHLACGYMTPQTTDKPEKTRRYDVSLKEKNEKEL